MKYVRGFFAFWYDFIVGDAWEVAAGVVLSLLLLYALAHFSGADAQTAGSGWTSYAALLLPLAIVALLGYSLWRVRPRG
ncbi:MAG: hypothetical protein QOH93_362 [Chloroflexia bacterium]|jgi:hypothetical protein|nr:hypothetical protein [Chloroflexia bacterium]